MLSILSQRYPNCLIFKNQKIIFPNNHSFSPFIYLSLWQPTYFSSSKDFWSCERSYKIVCFSFFLFIHHIFHQNTLFPFFFSELSLETALTVTIFLMLVQPLFSARTTLKAIPHPKTTVLLIWRPAQTPKCGLAAICALTTRPALAATPVSHLTAKAAVSPVQTTSAASPTTQAIPANNAMMNRHNA